MKEVNNNNKKYCIPNDTKHLKYRWKRIVFNKDEIIERCSHTSVLYNSQLYVIGGGKKESDYYIHFNDIWKIDITKQTCEKCIGDGESVIFQPRRGHSSCLYEDKIFIFGGIVGKISHINEPVELSNQLFIYDIKHNSLFEVKHDNSNIWPSPRRGHIAIILEEKMYIYGGDCIHSDALRLYVYDINSGMWSWIFQSNVPLQRELSLSSYDIIENYVLIFGGSSSNKLLTLNLKSGEWRDNSSYVRSSMPNTDVTRRFAASAQTLLNHQLFCIFGGSDDEYYDDVICIRVKPLINFSNYDDFKNGKPQCISSTVKPESRNGHVITRISDTQMILTFGGVFPNVYLNDIWLFELLIFPEIDDYSICNSILMYYQTLLRDDRFADIKIIFDNDEFVMCHRLVLCSRCKYFQTLLENGWSCENINCIEIKLKEMSSITFQWIKIFLYSGVVSPDVTNSPESLWSTIEMSDIFEIIELKTKCEQILMDTFKLEDCYNNNTDDNDNNDDISSMLILAERFSCLYLVERILLYLKFNFIIKMNKNKDNDNNDNNNNNNFMTLSNINELSEETLNKLKNIYDDIIVFD